MLQVRNEIQSLKMKHPKYGHSSIPKDITFTEILTIDFEIGE